MLMKVKVPTKLRVRTAPNFESQVRGFLHNKTIVNVEEPIDGWAKLNWYLVGDMKIRCSNACFVYAKYLKKHRTPKEYG